MREPLRQVYDEAEKRHADPQAAFGEVQARIAGRSARARPLAVLISAGSFAVLLVVGGAIFKLSEPPSAVYLSAKSIQGKSVEDGPDTATLLSMCKSFADSDSNTLDWGRAVDACQKVLVADPINIDARKLKRLAEKEVVQKKIYEDARHLLDLGEFQEAMQEYQKIDSDSFYWRLARRDFRTAAPLAMRAAGDACLADRKANAMDAAWSDCKRMMDVGDYLGLEGSPQLVQFKEAYAVLEKQHRQGDAWEPRRDYARFLRDTIDVDDAERQRNDAIKKMYADPEIAKAVAKYARDPNLGMQALQRYIGKGGKYEAEAKQAYLRMETMNRSHQTGYERMLRFDLKGAAGPFHTQLDADAQVMPKGYESDLARQTRHDISEKFATKGKELFQEGSLPESFESCQGGAEFQLGNPSVLECYSDLENKALVLVEQGCAGAQKAMEITRPDSPTHKRAEQVVKDHGC